LTGSFEPIQTGHPNVQDDYVRSELLGFLQRLAAIGGLTTNFPVGLGLQESTQAATYYLMIISYENSKGHPFTSHGELALAREGFASTQPRYTLQLLRQVA
jgi:hypothetical protein